MTKKKTNPRLERIDEWLEGRDRSELSAIEIQAMRSERLICGYNLPSKNVPCFKAPILDRERCRTHGGKKPRGPDHWSYKNGLYADAFKGDLKKKFARASSTEDPLNLLPELHAQRTLFAEYVSRFEENVPMKRDDIDALIRWGESITRTVERIFRSRALGALTIAEIEFLKVGILTLLEDYVPDPEGRISFIEGLTRLIPDRPSDISGEDVGGA